MNRQSSMRPKPSRPLFAGLTIACLILLFQNCSAPFSSESSFAIATLMGSQSAPPSPTPQPSPLSQATAPPQSSSHSSAISFLKIRLGRPLVIRGPVGDELDTVTTLLQKSDGSFNAYSSNRTVFLINAVNPWSLGGARSGVISPNTVGAADTCGDWMNSVFQVGSQWYGLAHNENYCNYSINQTNKSMAMYTSSNQGNTWSPLGTVISGMDQPTTGQITGEGDCTMIPGGDGYLYSYCGRYRGVWATIVARAPVASPNPGQWMKLYQGQWSQPGLGGNSDSLSFLGSSSAVLSGIAKATLVGTGGAGLSGISLSLSNDMVSFQTLNEPLINYDAALWTRPASSDLYAYPILNNATDGSRVLDPGHFFLYYTYLAPNTDFSQRLLVIQDVFVQAASEPQSPHVGVALSRWIENSTGIMHVTAAPVLGNDTTSSLQMQLGYVMTAPPSGITSIKIEECWGNWPGHDDFILSPDGSCTSAGYTRLRTVGWLYSSQQANSLPLYRCYNPAAQFHFASNSPSCEGLGTMEFILGYVLAQ